MSPDASRSPLGYTLTALQSFWYPKRRDDSAVLDSPAGDMLRHKFDHRVPKIQIDYPLNITGGDREVIAAELFEQDRWGRTFTLEKRDLSHHRSNPTKSSRSTTTWSVPSCPVPSLTRPRKPSPPAARSRPRPEPRVLIEDFEADNGGMKGVRLAYIHEGETGFMANLLRARRGLRRVATRRRLLHRHLLDRGFLGSQRDVGRVDAPSVD